MQCSRCGRIDDRAGARMCSNCGAPLVAPGYAAPQPVARRKGGSGWLVAFVVGGVGLLLAAGGASFAYWWYALRAGGGATAGDASDVTCKEGTCAALDSKRETHLTIQSRDPELAKVRLVVPAGAMSDGAVVRVSAAREPLDFVVRGGLTRAKAIGTTIHLEPEGATFTKPVVVKLPYSAARAKALVPPPTIAVAVLHRDPGGKPVLEAVKPDAVDTQAGIVTISLHHFSDAVAVAQPEDPKAIQLEDGAAPAPTASGTPSSNAGPGCAELTRVMKSTPCLEVDSDAFFDGAGIDTEFKALGDFHCPLPGFTDSREGYRLCRLATYLDTEDGGWTNFKGIGLWNHIPVKPMRSGFEVQLYNEIKDHLRSQPGVPLTQSDLLRLAMESARGPDGKTNLSSALLTAHNVVRAFARPTFWQADMVPKDGTTFDAKGNARLCPDDQPNCGQTDPETWGHSPNDPMYPLFLDAFGAKSSDGGQTLKALRKAKGLPTSYLGDGTFRNGIFAALPGMNPDFAGGCYYYFWVGVMAAAGGETAARMGIKTESAVKGAAGEAARGEAETACALKGVELVHCMNEAKQISEKSAAACSDAGTPTPPVASSAPPPLSGPDALHVRVTDEKTGAAVPAAHVHATSLSGTAASDGVTDGDGRADIHVLADGIQFTVAHDGCESKTVKFPRGTGALPKDAVPVKISCNQSISPASTSTGCPVLSVKGVGDCSRQGCPDCKAIVARCLASPACAAHVSCWKTCDSNHSCPGDHACCEPGTTCYSQCYNVKERDCAKCLNDAVRCQDKFEDAIDKTEPGGRFDGKRSSIFPAGL